MSNKGAPSNWPPTFPRFLRNSAMTPAFQSLIVIDGRYIVTRRDLLTSNIEKLATWSCRDTYWLGIHPCFSNVSSTRLNGLSRDEMDGSNSKDGRLPINCIHGDLYRGWNSTGSMSGQ